MTRRITVSVTTNQLRLIIDGLDEKEYRTADETYRNDGYVLGAGSDDPETAREIAALRRIHARLEHVLHEHEAFIMLFDAYVRHMDDEDNPRKLAAYIKATDAFYKEVGVKKGNALWRRYQSGAGVPSKYRSDVCPDGSP